jgi:multidrug efflux pump subunit AcrA (membrane-fusion protein)
VQFRQKALAKLQSPEELDLPVRFARPQGWLVLSITIVVMAGASFWAFTGSISSKLSAPGILTHGQGSYVLQSPVAGQVTQVLAEQGEQLAADAPLLKLRTQAGATTVVRTLAAGRVTTLVATIGTVVTTGADVAAVERVAQADDPIVAVLYLSAANAASVPLGATVDLTVESVAGSRYGSLRGHVQSVGPAAQTQAQIAAFLGDSQLAEDFSRQGRPVPVLVRLGSKAAAAAKAIGSMTPATGSVRLAAQRPIDWLLP